MTALQVRDFPEDLYEELKAFAKAEDRSLSQQTVHIIREYLAMQNNANESGSMINASIDRVRVADRRKQEEAERQERIEKRRKLYEELKSRKPIELPEELADVAGMIRSMREERDNRLVPELKDVK